MGRKAAALAAASPAAAAAGEAAAGAISGKKKATKRNVTAIQTGEETQASSADTAIPSTQPAVRSSKKAKLAQQQQQHQRQQHKQQQQQQQQHGNPNKRPHLLPEEEDVPQSPPEATSSNTDTAAAAETATAAAEAITTTTTTATTAATAAEAAAASDPYLLADVEYLRTEKRWLNRQRVLVLGSRGIAAQTRFLLEDIKRLLPHHKAETKWEKKEKLQSIAELCQLRSCNNVFYLEQRKNDVLLHLAKIPLGPTFIARIMNVETLNEARLSGNCLLHSRPLLVFSNEFEGRSYLKVLKELFTQVFGTPRNHQKSKPFFDHVFCFFIADSRIWFRHYQIAPLVVGEGGDANNPHRQTYIEIGPRFVMDPVKILEGSFCGKTLWRNADFVRTRDLLRPRRLQAALAFARRQGQKEKRKLYLDSVLKNEPTNKLAPEGIFGVENVVLKPQTPKP